MHRSGSLREAGYESLERAGDRKDIINSAAMQFAEMEFTGPLKLEVDSVYGAFIGITQVARSMDWCWTMCMLAARSFLLLCLNYLLQTSAIIFIGEASQVMDVLGGKMHLCDFAMRLDQCPDGPGCLGPGGTKYTPSRLYAYDVWALRTFVRDSLIGIMPSHKDEIMEKVDPGEYGMENYYCRLAACFIFMMAEVRDLFQIYELAMVLYMTPSRAQSWVLRDPSVEPDAKGSLGALQFETAGMPMHWKIIFILTIIVPKSFLWWSVCWMGFRFLMETAGIANLILGAMTMDFILTFDELIFDSFGNVATKSIMTNLKAFELSEEEELRRAERIKQIWGGAYMHITLMVPRRLLLTLAFMAGFLYRYYYFNCERSPDGAYVSQPMFTPKSSYYNLWNFLMNSVPESEDPFWTMPDGE